MTRNGDDFGSKQIDLFATILRLQKRSDLTGDLDRKNSISWKLNPLVPGIQTDSGTQTAEKGSTELMAGPKAALVHTLIAASNILYWLLSVSK